MADKRKIAFQGVPGAYSHMACNTHAPKHIPLPCESFSEMIAAVQNGDAELAMVPVENSTAGRVADIHHLLPESDLQTFENILEGSFNCFSEQFNIILSLESVKS